MSVGERETGPAAGVPTLPRRRRRWRRVLNALLGLAIFVTLGVGVLRVMSLWGIPDAPEPFDVAAYRAETIPNATNAVVLFKEAERRLGGPQELTLFGLMGRQREEYIAAKPETREWIEAHRPAMEVWRQGTERPDAGPTGHVLPVWSPVFPDEYLHSWLRVAGLEASRLENANDLEGAWRWHKARLRATLLVGRRRGIQTRHHLAKVFDQVSRRAREWAEDPGMTVPLLRRAIADVEAMAPLHGAEADSLKTDYLALMADYDDFADNSRGPGDIINRAAHIPRASMTAPSAGTLVRVVPPEMLRPLYARLVSVVEAEPERSRRLTRMIFANWLAQADKRPADRPATVSTYPLVFDEDAGPTPSLPPSALSRRAATAPYLAIARTGFAPLPWWFAVDEWPKTYRADRVARAELILSFADRIYELETGTRPPNDEALVGKVLPRLPDDYDPSAAAP